MAFGSNFHIVFVIINCFYLPRPPYPKHPINGAGVVLVIPLYLFSSHKVTKSKNTDNHIVDDVELLQLGIRNAMIIFLICVITNTTWINHTPFGRYTCLHIWVQYIVIKLPIHSSQIPTADPISSILHDNCTHSYIFFHE